MSGTHPHIAAAIATIASELDGEELTILDVGCGDGTLLGYLADRLPDRLGRPIRLLGFDVHDSGHVVGEFPESTVERLSMSNPGWPWEGAISVVGVEDPWPYPDESVDILYSNQVLEHIFDPDRFFREHRRVLRPGGRGIHVFPARQIVIEPHLGVPLLHWLSNGRNRYRLARLAARRGAGRYAAARRERDTDEVAQQMLSLLDDAVAYVPRQRMAAAAKRAGLELRPCFVMGYYLQKLRSIASRPPLESYRRSTASIQGAMSVVLGTAASITVVVSRPQ